ncbi:MAG: RNA-directed DNA polymerase [Acidobacteria bacterium]|nr:RNA-directed DNA polymerase [Acidobacteriota bacterium]
MQLLEKNKKILEEMVRLGFWPESQPLPGLNPEEQTRYETLSNELAAIRTELTRLKNREAMLKAIRAQRLADAKRKRLETKARNEEKRLERARTWKQIQAKQITYLGMGVSAGLSEQVGQSERLKTQGLPSWSTPAELAKAMNISVGELRFLTFHRRVVKHSHYIRFHMPKKTGGTRLISAPMPRLKELQHWVLEHVLEKIPIHDSAHGFRKHHSIVTNAQPHVGQPMLINLDLKDFFPTLTYRRVKGLFRQLGYSESIATVLGLLCTEPEMDQVKLDGQPFLIAKGDRHLPQGAPSSPMITNLICRRMDQRLAKLAASFGFIYSRYADDLSFSGAELDSRETGRLLKRIQNIVNHEGFVVHPHKTKICRSGQRKEVTGIVVNSFCSVDRKTRKKIRAILHHIEKDGPSGKNFGANPDVLEALLSYAQFMAMVNPEQGLPVLNKVKALANQIGYKRKTYRRLASSSKRFKRFVPDPALFAKPEPAPSLQKETAEQRPTPLPKQDLKTNAEAPAKKPWWKFW